MRMRRTLLPIFLLTWVAQAQITQFPYLQNFDSVTVPNLPPGWSATTNRSASGDFTTSAGTAKSSPNAVLSTNPRISQSLISPILDFSNRFVDSVIFFERRSNTDTTGILVEASTDGGTTFGVVVSDTLQLLNPTTYVRRAFVLPSVLSGKSNVKIRWRVLSDPRGSSTATLRFDDILIMTKTQFDAGITAIAFSPPFPSAGDSVIVAATVRNFGRQTIQNVLVEFYDDRNFDSLPQPAELFDTVRISASISPGDSTSIAAVMRALPLGDKQIIVQAALSNDENPTNDRRIAKVTAGLRRFSVVINEIMYAPPTGEPEWVELFNSSSDTINLKSWKVSNRTTSSRYTIASSDVFLPSQQFAVVAKDTALLFAAHSSIPSIVLQASSMPTFLFNNNGDAVVIFDSRGAAMDSVRYTPTWGGTNGRSLERDDALLASNDSTNWGSSGDSTGSSPGRTNSLTPVQFDLRAERISARVITANQSLEIRVSVLNVGRDAASNFAVSLFYDADGDSIPQQSELLERQSFGAVLQPRDSLIVDFVWSSPGYGRKLMILQIEYPQDLRRSNNIIFGVIKISVPPQSLIINEIMYTPFSGQAEYVELYNRSGRVIDISDWKISDMRDASGKANEFVITRRLYFVQPEAYILVASDSSIMQQFNLASDSSRGIHLFIMNRSGLSLNNEGDDVVLSDLTGSIIDSLRYSPDWHNAQITDVTGRALERINPELPSTDRRNWSTSANPLGGTPGKQNSIHTVSVPSSASLSFSPNPFSPDGDGFEDFTVISYEVPTSAALVRIRIYDARGRLVRTLANSDPSGARGSLIWDGMNDNRDRVRMGIYIVLLEALDSNGVTVHATKGVVVVAVKL